MDGKYLFAIFVFFLCAMLILMAKFLFASRKKPDDLIMKEEKLLRLYGQIEDMMESFEEYAREIQESITVQRDNISRDMNKIKNEITALAAEKKQELETPIFREISPETIKTVSSVPKEELTQETIEEKTRRAMKSQGKSAGGENKNGRIIELYRQGMDEAAIAKKMNMTLSEVRLIISVNGG